MSLRRSARNQATVIGKAVTESVQAAVPPTKRARSRSKPSTKNDTDQSSSNDISSTQASNGFKVPTTPSPTKRRRVEPVTPVPPITPTPSLIGVMFTPRPSYSTGDIDDAIPSATFLPAEPHLSNAPLHTTSGTHVPPGAVTARSDRLPRAIGTTSATILEDAKAHLIRTDPGLRSLVDAHHCKVFDPTGLSEEIDPFRSLASGIMAQQVSGAAASSIKNKFIRLFTPTTDAAGEAATFPSPAQVAQTPLPRLREAGLSQRKAEYIQGLAEKFVSDELSAEMLAAADDEEVMRRLVAVRGLGAWSVEMFMCFGLKRMDILSTGDLGVQRGMAVYKGKDVARLKNKGGKWKYMSEQDMIATAEPFRPYRSLFMWYMWRIETAPGQGGTNVDAMQNNT